MGANIYQDRGDNRTFTQDNPNLPGFGDNLEVNPKNDVGFFGGIKLGYVFGTGVVRPTVEGDFFYNGFRGGANLTLRDIDNNVLAQSKKHHPLYKQEGTVIFIFSLFYLDSTP